MHTGHAGFPIDTVLARLARRADMTNLARRARTPVRARLAVSAVLAVHARLSGSPGRAGSAGVAVSAMDASRAWLPVGARLAGGTCSDSHRTEQSVAHEAIRHMPPEHSCLYLLLPVILVTGVCGPKRACVHACPCAACTCPYACSHKHTRMYKKLH
jgi:hypothetical protein